VLAVRQLAAPYAVILGTIVMCGAAWLTFIAVIKRLED
jgi:hypothetical protein